MANIQINAPTGQSFEVEVPDGDQFVSITILECDCGCGEWFQSIEPTQIYVNEDHRVKANNAKRKKTHRVQHKK